MTIRLTLLALLAAALAAAPASAAGPVPLLASEFTQDVAVAGPRVIVSRAAPLGSIEVDALPATGGPARRLLTTPQRGEDWDAYSVIAASPQRVAVVIGFFAPDAHVEFEAYTGPPTGPLTLIEHVDEDARFVPDLPVIDGNRVAILEASRHAHRLRVLDAGMAPRFVRLHADVTGPLALAGNRLAVQSDDDVVILDLATGSPVRSVPANDTSTLDLAANGALAFDGEAGVLTVMPNGLRQGVPDGDFLSRPAFAGDALAAVETIGFDASRPVVLAPGAIHPRPVGLPSLSIDEIDADAQGVAWEANDCVLYATLDTVAPAEPPTGPCPVAEVGVENGGETVHGRRLRLVATCIAARAAGCVGTATIHLVRGGVIARGTFSVPAGQRRRFTMRFTRRGVRLARELTRGDDVADFDLTTRIAGGGPPNDDGLVFVSRVRKR